MQDIKNVTPIKDEDDESLMDYYVMLQSHIAEACKAGLLERLLIPANVEMMVLPLSAWEKRVWREAQGGLPAEWLMEEFVEDRLVYATNMVAMSERHVLPKPIRLHRSQRSLSSEGRGGRYGRGNSSGRNTRVMRAGAQTGKRCASRHRRTGIQRLSGPRSASCSGSAAKNIRRQSVTHSRSCLRSRG
jgi:hypothetical protein